MKKSKKIVTKLVVAGMVISGMLSSCEKDAHTPPALVFKTGASYTSADDTVAKNTSITVGITADKTEDELKTYNISYAYDGAATSTSKENYTVSSKEEDHYTKDYTFTTRNQAGTEKWSFTMTDRDGNIATKSITLIVQ